ncbi:MAG: 30S ribosomal protein S8 [Enterobacterales bacterium]
MSVQDPISDMLTRIRNSQKAYQDITYIPSSNIKIKIAKILEEEGFIKKYYIIGERKKLIKIILKYFNKKPVIENIQCISKPSLRIYKKTRMLPIIMSGMGIVIVSTSKGIMTGHSAKKLNIGGEIICQVS